MDWSKILGAVEGAAHLVESDQVQAIIGLGGPQAAAIGKALKLSATLAEEVTAHAGDAVDLSSGDLAKLKAAQARIQAQGDVLDAAIEAEA